MKQWFNQRTDQERILIIVAAGLLVLFLLYMLLLRSLVQGNDELRVEIEEQQGSLEWMQNASAELRRLQSASRGVSAQDSRSLIARVTSELKTKSIIPTAIQPEGEKRLRLTFDSIPFSALMERLDLLQNEYGIYVTQASFEPDAKTKGRVSARLTLSR